MAVTTQQTGQFAGYTLADLRALTLRFLRVGNTNRYSPTAGSADYDWIDDALNRGQEDFVRRTKCLRTYAVSQLQAEKRVYRLPSDFLDVMAVYFYNSDFSEGYRDLVIKTVEELNYESSDWRTKQGTPEIFYIDRIYGSNQMFGLYPIPDTTGEVPTTDAEEGTIVTWVCPNYTYTSEYGTILNLTSDEDTFLLTYDGSTVAEVSSIDNDLYIEYYRLPQSLEYATQYAEISQEYHKSLAYFAAADLLSNNPEDSVEFKRSGNFEKKFEREIQVYINERKSPLSGHNLKAMPAVWNWTQNMQFMKDLP